MNKKTNNLKEVRNQNYQDKKMNTWKPKDKNLLVVELLFVQIGLPDNLLIKLLKTKKKAKELIKMINH